MRWNNILDLRPDNHKSSQTFKGRRSILPMLCLVLFCDLSQNWRSDGTYLCEESKASSACILFDLRSIDHVYCASRIVAPSWTSYIQLWRRQPYGICFGGTDRPKYPSVDVLKVFEKELGITNTTSPTTHRILCKNFSHFDSFHTLLSAEVSS
jgi:hypothetical protein